jgi:anti-sigma factor RsiW
MNINRHNYETFFLLYVDKELSAPDRKAVEEFVQENPDLQMELELLQATVIKADDTVLDKKDWLYMEEEITALQENLLLYADDELTAADKRSVEALLATDTKARAEWAVLQQTKLQPDMDVVFEEKAVLYRHETGRIVVFRWWRAAAAAILIGFGIFTGVSVYNNYKTKPATEVVATGQKAIPVLPGDEIPRKKNNAMEESPENSNRENVIVTTLPDAKRSATNEKVKTTGVKMNSSTGVTVKDDVAVQQMVIDKPKNNLPKPNLENINRRPRNETVVAGVLPENNNSNIVSGNNAAVSKTNPKENFNNVVVAGTNIGKTDAAVKAMLVSNSETDNGENNNRYLDVDDGKQKRTALGGFLRKAKRVLERTANVNTGEGIKVAGFEIALK